MSTLVLHINFIMLWSLWICKVIQSLLVPYRDLNTQLLSDDVYNFRSGCEEDYDRKEALLQELVELQEEMKRQQQQAAAAPKHIVGRSCQK